MAPSYSSVPIAGGDTATPLNIQKRIRIIERWVPLAGSRILDCGCGQGDYVGALAARGAHASGIEFSAEKVAAWKLAHPDDGRVRQGNIEQLDLPSDSVDCVLLNEVIEHVPNEAAALREAHRVLRPNGLLLLFGPNRRYPFETHGVFSRRSGRKIPPATPFVPYIPVRLGNRFFRYWARNYWPSEMERLVKSANFDVVAHDFVWQTFENISGQQPKLLRAIRPLLRALADGLERTPLARTLGASQLVVARKP